MTSTVPPPRRRQIPESLREARLRLRGTIVILLLCIGFWAVVAWLIFG